MRVEAGLCDYRSAVAVADKDARAGLQVEDSIPGGRRHYFAARGKSQAFDVRIDSSIPSSSGTVTEI
jgi:hypothetical protein